MNTGSELRAEDFIYTIGPGPPNHDLFADGETPFYIFYGYRFDTSITPTDMI